MKTRMIRTISPQGVTQYEEVIDLEGVCELAQFMYRNGVRTPVLEAMIKFLAVYPRPTKKQFEEFLKSQGKTLVNVDGVFVDN